MYFLAFTAGVIAASIWWLGYFNTRERKTQNRLYNRIYELEGLLSVHWQDNKG